MATASLADSLSHFHFFLLSETALGWMLVGWKVTLVFSHTLHLCKCSHEDNSAPGHCSKLPGIKIYKCKKQNKKTLIHTSVHLISLSFFSSTICCQNHQYLVQSKRTFPSLPFSHQHTTSTNRSSHLKLTLGIGQHPYSPPPTLQQVFPSGQVNSLLGQITSFSGSL